MHILVATDGALDPELAADAVARWFEPGDAVSVFTTMNVPSDFLEHIGDPGIKQAATIALEAGQGIGDRAAEQLTGPPADHATAPVDDSPVIRALRTEAAKRMDPIVAALKGRGIKADSTWTTTDNRTAKSIAQAMRRHDTGLVIIGSHGGGRFEGLLGSTGTKLVRRAPASVLVIRTSGPTE